MQKGNETLEVVTMGMERGNEFNKTSQKMNLQNLEVDKLHEIEKRRMRESISLGLV